MPVAVVVDFEGATLDQYDAIAEKLGFEPGGTGAPGGLFHWVTGTENGFRITDVWETREQFEEFFGTKAAPLIAETGAPEPASITFHEVHNHLTAA